MVGSDLPDSSANSVCDHPSIRMVMLCQYVTYNERKCLFWPFSKNGGFPASVAYCGKIYKPTLLWEFLLDVAPGAIGEASRSPTAPSEIVVYDKRVTILTQVERDWRDGQCPNKRNDPSDQGPTEE
jgi:hypothetical protein